MTKPLRTLALHCNRLTGAIANVSRPLTHEKA